MGQDQGQSVLTAQEEKLPLTEPSGLPPPPHPADLASYSRSTASRKAFISSVKDAPGTQCGCADLYSPPVELRLLNI